MPARTARAPAASLLTTLGLTAVVAAGGGAAFAGPAGNLDLNVFHPAMDSRGYLTINASQVLGDKEVSFGLGSLDWGHHLLKLEGNGATYAIDDIISSDDESECFYECLMNLTWQPDRCAHLRWLQEWVAAAQARTDAFSASVVPLYERWLAWLGSSNIYASHYAAIAMILSLRRSGWHEVISRARFGELPDEVEHLLALIQLRIRSERLGITSIVEREREIVIRPIETGKMNTRKLIGRFGHAIKITPPTIAKDPSDSAVAPPAVVL